MKRKFFFKCYKTIDKVLKIFERHAVTSKSAKEKKYRFKKELAKNEQKAIESLLKEIEKKKKLSEEQINQAANEMRNISKSFGD